MKSPWVKCIRDNHAVVSGLSQKSLDVYGKYFDPDHI